MTYFKHDFMYEHLSELNHEKVYTCAMGWWAVWVPICAPFVSLWMGEDLDPSAGAFLIFDGACDATGQPQPAWRCVSRDYIVKRILNHAFRDVKHAQEQHPGSRVLLLMVYVMSCLEVSVVHEELCFARYLVPHPLTATQVRDVLAPLVDDYPPANLEFPTSPLRYAPTFKYQFDARPFPGHLVTPDAHPCSGQLTTTKALTISWDTLCRQYGHKVTDEDFDKTFLTRKKEQQLSLTAQMSNCKRVSKRSSKYAQ